MSRPSVAVAAALGLALRHRVGEAGGLDRVAFPPFAGFEREVAARDQVAHEVRAAGGSSR